MARTKKLLTINVEDNTSKDYIKGIAIDDIKAIINNKHIVAKSGEEVSLSKTEFLFLKSRIELC